MLSAILGTAAGVILYSTGIVLIRYLYVISSFKDNIEKVIKRDHFVVHSILIGESINFLTVGSIYLQMGDSEREKSPMMLYQACINPWNDHTIPVFNIFPWNHCCFVFLAGTNVACTLFLYKFLDNVTERSSSVSEVDKKKERRRNLTTACMGMVDVGIYLTIMTIFMFTYSFKTDIIDSF
jgi:hypothetical protein